MIQQTSVKGTTKRRKSSQQQITVGIDIGDRWSHYCILDEDGEVVEEGRFRTVASSIDKQFRRMPKARIAMEAGTHSIWMSEQLREFGHEVLVANVTELRAIVRNINKSDQVDAEKLARYARLDPKILRTITHRSMEAQQALTLIRARHVFGANARGRRECGARLGKALRTQVGRLLDALLCAACSRGAAGRTNGRIAPVTRTDREHDPTDQNLRPAGSAVDAHKVLRGELSANG